MDEDEEWWPGRVLGVHSQGAHAGLFDVLYDDGEFELFKPSRRVRLPPFLRVALGQTVRNTDPKRPVM